MTYTIIIILITFLIVCGIGASAVQQFNDRKMQQKREELSRQKVVFEETEESIVAALQMPVSQMLITLMRKRSCTALKAIYAHNKSAELEAKINDIQKVIKAADGAQTQPDQSTFILPPADKVIIKYIQAVKKLRVILRSEYNKGNVTPTLYSQEDTALCSLQLRVNAETLMKRANDAIAKNQQGSARQYIEKGINALGKHKPQNEYTQTRKVEFEDTLNGLELNVRDNNLKQIMADKAKECEDIESLFAPKKKW